MRIRLVLHSLGKVLLILGAAMLLPLVVSIIYGGEDLRCFLYSIPLVLAAAGGLLWGFKPRENQSMRQREGFLLVSLVWVFCAFFGCIPYVFAEMFPSFVDALFESMSGFTTTGASALRVVEDLPKGLLFWRALTHWLGGAGIVMLFVALLKGKDGSGSGVQIFNAEHSGSELTEKISPRVRDAAQALSYVYLGLTVVLVALLLLGGMNLYDALIHAFGTVSTGGFSDRNISVAFYESPYIHWVIIIFMFLSSVNFSLYFLLFARRKLNLFRDEETRVFFIICLVGLVLISFDLIRTGFYPGESIGYSIRQAAFQTVSVISTTGFATANYDAWPNFSRGILFLLMFVGGCAGSTSSSIKVSRLVVLFRAVKMELQQLIYPRSIKKITYNGKTLQSSTVSHMMFYMIIFIAITFISGLLLTACGMDLVGALSASLSCISNVGPGFGSVGAAENYADVAAFGKYVLIFNMLVGRLELFTVLVLFLPSAWRR